MANDDPDYTAGDMVFIVKELPHSVFTRKGNDLQVKITIDLPEAFTGFTRKIEHLDKHIVEIKEEEVTEPGSIKKVLFEGIPYHEAGSQRGDLHAEITVNFPQSLTETQKQGKIITINIIALRKFFAKK